MNDAKRLHSDDMVLWLNEVGLDPGSDLISKLDKDKHIPGKHSLIMPQGFPCKDHSVQDEGRVVWTVKLSYSQAAEFKRQGFNVNYKREIKAKTFLNPATATPPLIQQSGNGDSVPQSPENPPDDDSRRWSWDEWEYHNRNWVLQGAWNSYQWNRGSWSEAVPAAAPANSEANSEASSEADDAGNDADSEGGDEELLQSNAEAVPGSCEE